MKRKTRNIIRTIASAALLASPSTSTSSKTTTVAPHIPIEIPPIFPHSVTTISEALSHASLEILADPEATPEAQEATQTSVFEMIVIEDGSVEDCVGTINISQAKDYERPQDGDVIQYEPGVATFPELIDPPDDQYFAQEQLHLESDTEFGYEATVAINTKAVADDDEMNKVAAHLMAVVSNGCRLFMNEMAGDITRPTTTTTATKEPTQQFPLVPR